MKFPTFIVLLLFPLAVLAAAPGTTTSRYITSDGTPATLGTVLQLQNASGTGSDAIDATHPLPVSGSFTCSACTFAGSVTAASGAFALGSIVDIGTGASPAANTLNARLITLNTTLGSPLQADGAVTIGGTLPAFAATPTFNVGTLNGAATAANQAGQITAEQAIQASTAAISAQLPAALGQKLMAASEAVTIASDQSAIPISATSLPLPNGAATGFAQGGATSGQTGTLIQCAVTTSAPTYTTGNSNPCSLTVNGELRTSLFDAGSGNPVFVGAFTADGQSTGAYRLAVDAALRAYNGTSEDRLRGDANGLVTQPYAFAANNWSYAAASGGISNTTTAVTIKAAAGASIRNCITHVDIDAGTLGAATEVAIRDGAAGTVIWRGFEGTGGGFKTINEMNPLCGTANTLLEVVTLTATVTGGVYVNASGFTR